MAERRLFIAGSTGAVGRTVVRLARQRQVSFFAHARPKPGRSASSEPHRVLFELSDTETLVRTLEGCSTILQLIGTVRSRFLQGDTYDSSDVGTTRQLLKAGKMAGVDHFVLLSSVGAGRPVGAYLKAKAEAERIVRESELAFTIFRPSAFVGEGHRLPLASVTRFVMRRVGLRTLEPIEVEELARALLRCALDRAPLGEVLQGEPLWHLVETATAPEAMPQV
jgi:uncharacterized protein YbjT (DUF2867 family)